MPDCLSDLFHMLPGNIYFKVATLVSRFCTCHSHACKGQLKIVYKKTVTPAFLCVSDESLEDETTQYIPPQLEHHRCSASHCGEGYYSSSVPFNLKKKIQNLQ